MKGKKNESVIDNIHEEMYINRQIYYKGYGWFDTDDRKVMRP